MVIFMLIPQGSYSFTDFNDDEVVIGKYTAIAARCIFHGSDNHQSVINRKKVANNIPPDGVSKGRIVLGNDVWLGFDVRVLSGVTIGDGAIIGAGAVIAKDVPPYAIVVGNPGRIVKYRFPKETIARLCKISWWNWRDKVIETRKADFEDVDIFIAKYG